MSPIRYYYQIAVQCLNIIYVTSLFCEMRIHRVLEEYSSLLDTFTKR